MDWPWRSLFNSEPWTRSIAIRFRSSRVSQSNDVTTGSSYLKPSISTDNFVITAPCMSSRLILLRQSLTLEGWGRLLFGRFAGQHRAEDEILLSLFRPRWLALTHSSYQVMTMTEMMRPKAGPRSHPNCGERFFFDKNSNDNSSPFPPFLRFCYCVAVICKQPRRNYWTSYIEHRMDSQLAGKYCFQTISNSFKNSKRLDFF